MKINHCLIVLTLLGTFLFAGCNTKQAAPITIPAGAQAGDLVGLKPCEYEANGDKFAAECGSLVVSENWGKAESRLIALPVVRIPASGANPAEPIFFLEGGPGGPNLVWAPPAWLLENHDVVMVGYRGVEGTVTLDCPEVNRVQSKHKGRDLFSEQARTEFEAATKQCATRLQVAGIDLSGYTVPAVIKDMEAARKALRYERINLFSQSYGTRVAQVYAYMHPDSLRRLVLIGVNTPGHFIWKPVDFDKMIEHISELCAQDESCSGRTSDFARTMYNVNRNMPKRWLFFNIDPDTVRFATHFLFFSNSSMTPVFDAYLAAEEGDPSGLAMMNLVMRFMPFEPVWGDLFNKGGTVDLKKYEGIESVSLGGSIMGAPLSEFVWPMAKDWPVELIPEDLRQFQETDVEMLLVNGTVDFSTPPSALDEAKSYYHNAQMILLPEFSHVGDVTTLQPQAFERLITNYYDTGVADDSLFVYQPLTFKPGFSLTALARLLITALFVLPALVAYGIVVIARRVSRHRMSR